jgi:hypothetical protein
VINRRPEVLLLALALLLAACGGSARNGGVARLAQGDVAVVGSRHVTKAMLGEVVHLEKLELMQSAVPRVVSSADLKNQAMIVLVQHAEQEDAAARRGIQVSGGDVRARMQEIEDQYFGGSPKAYEAEWAKEGLSREDVEVKIRVELLSERLVADVVGKQQAEPDQRRVMARWLNQLTKSFCVGHEIRYARGYRPHPDPCTAYSAEAVPDPLPTSLDQGSSRIGRRRTTGK